MLTSLAQARPKQSKYVRHEPQRLLSLKSSVEQIGHLTSLSQPCPSSLWQYSCNINHMISALCPQNRQYHSTRGLGQPWKEVPHFKAALLKVKGNVPGDMGALSCAQWGSKGKRVCPTQNAAVTGCSQLMGLRGRRLTYAFIPGGTWPSQRSIQFISSYAKSFVWQLKTFCHKRPFLCKTAKEP